MVDLVNNNIVFKHENICIEFCINVNKFNRCKLIVKRNNILKYDIEILDIEMLDCVRNLYLFKNDKLNYSEIINILDNNIKSNNLI